MQTLKTVLFPTLIILLSASIVTAVLWGVSKSEIADRMRNDLGGEIAAPTMRTASSTAAQPSPQESVRAIASFVRVMTLGFLKIIVLMGIPGTVTLIVVNLAKHNRRQGNELQTG